MRRIVLVLLCFLYPAMGIGQIQTDTNPAENIMKKVIERSDRNDARKQISLAYLRTYEAYNLGPNRELLDLGDQSVTRIRPNPNGNESIEEIIEEDGKPIHKRSKKDNDTLIDIGSILGNRYQFDLASPSIITEAGKDYIVILFKPRAGKLPDLSSVDTIANSLAGTIYVDIEDLYIKRMDAALIRPIAFGRGLVKVSSMTVRIEQEQRPDLDNIVVVSSTVVYGKYWVNYVLYSRDRFQKRSWTYKDYTKVTIPPK